MLSAFLFCMMSVLPGDSCSDLVIPKVIAPNGCIGCENFSVHTSCEFSQFELQLFDRMGNRKFKMNDPDTELDITQRTADGKHMFKAGVYVYWVKAQMQGGALVIYKGAVTFIL